LIVSVAAVAKRGRIAYVIWQNTVSAAGCDPAKFGKPERQRVMADKQPPPLRVVIDGKEREVTYEELALSNNLAQEALVRLLVDKDIIDAKELLDSMQRIKQERYRPAPPEK
jgi:hypothetical protein